MRNNLKSLSVLCTLFGLCIGSPAKADTVRAMCEYYPNGEHLPEVRMPCSVYQSQGFVDITWQDGIISELNPVDLERGIYVDKRGGRVSREDNPRLGDWKFTMEAGSILVYWLR